MNVTFAKSDLSDSNVRAQIVSLIDKAKHGGFIFVKALKTKGGHGEVSDYTFCKGINYDNTKKNSLDMLQKIIADSSFSVEVKRGTWQNAMGEMGNKSKAFPRFVVVTKTYKQGDDALIKALGAIGESILAAKDATASYKSLGNGIYENDNGCLYLRDLRKVSKTVITKGDYPNSASGELVAIADTIKRSMPIGNYRTFNLDGDYQSISIDGVSLSQEVEQVKEEELVEA